MYDMLPASQHAAWLESNKRSHYFVFASFVVFNLISATSWRFATIWRRFGGPRSAAQAQYGCAALMHACLSLGAAAWYLTNKPPWLACGHSDVCFNSILFRLLDMHAGFLVYELIFFYNNASVLRPRFPLLGVHHCVALVAFVVAKAYPATLTVMVLPWYELLALSQAAEAVLDIAMALNMPANVRWQLLKACTLLGFWRAAGAVALAFRCWWWTRKTVRADHNSSTDAAPMSQLYMAGVLTTGFAMAVIQSLWFMLTVKAMRVTKAALAIVQRGARHEKTSTTRPSSYERRRGRGG